MTFMTKALELNLILEELKKFAKSDTVRQAILNLEPMIDYAEIERSLIEVYDMSSLISRNGNIPFLDNYDIDELINYAKMMRIYSIKEILYIRLFLAMERDIIRYFKEARKNKISLHSIESYEENLSNHQPLLDYITSKIDEDGLVLDQATPDLLRIRKDLRRLEKSLQDKVQKLLIDYSTYVNESVIVIRNDRFCIPIKEAFKNKIKGIIHDVSSSKQTVYIEPEATRQITAEIESLKVQEDQEIQKILSMISDEVSKNADTLKGNLDVFIALDFISSKSRYAMITKSIKPELNESGMISLIQARHPLLDPQIAVPISLEFNENIKTLLITGPNTGGKTVALKTVGLLTLMTQCGLLIPASEGTKISIFHQVFADIGDEQSILQSLSTFSSHLNKIIKMIEEVKDRTLVLLDELGSGTDPNEGVSLAMAILDYFRKFDIRMMVTTHYSELKSYAYEQSHMATASVAFDKKSLKPLYYLQMGTTGSSHAFLIARRLGLKEEVVSHAETLFKGRQTDLAKVMEKLNDEMAYLEKQKEKLRNEIHFNRKEKESFIKQRELLIKEQDQLIEKIKERETKKWEELKDEVRLLLLELKSKKELSNPEIAQIKFQLNQSVDTNYDHRVTDELSVGDLVFIMPYQQYGTIKSIEKDQYRVIFGKFDLTFQQTDLKKESNTQKTVKKNTEQQIKPTGSTPAKTANFELDLRGFRFEEVKDAVDQAIDRAMLSGLSQIRIIHGFGTGAVRKAVYDYIKSSPYIKSHRFGGEGEGLNGVTIITLK
jgi:DNA mismatch repair protein MutS2